MQHLKGVFIAGPIWSNGPAKGLRAWRHEKVEMHHHSGVVEPGTGCAVRLVIGRERLHGMHAECNGGGYRRLQMGMPDFERDRGAHWPRPMNGYGRRLTGNGIQFLMETEC